MWMSFLAEYDFIKRYNLSKHNSAAEYLPRCSCHAELLAVAVIEDNLVRVVHNLDKIELPIGTSIKMYRSIRATFRIIAVHKDYLYRATPKVLRLVLPIKDDQQIFSGLHDEISHWDFQATYDMITERFLRPK